MAQLLQPSEGGDQLCVGLLQHSGESFEFQVRRGLPEVFLGHVTVSVPCMPAWRWPGTSQ
jgi:hypothetical protein